MIVHSSIKKALENVSPDALSVTMEVLKDVALEYFILRTSTTLDKAEARFVKQELDAVCRVVSHIELALKPSNDKESYNV